MSLFNPIHCNAMGYIDVAWPTPAKQVDCIEYRAVDWVSATHTILSQSGSACATAKSRATCLSVQESGVRSGLGGINWPCISAGLTCSRSVLATTQADTVDIANSAATVKTMLAPIDSEQEALFVAMATGKELSCQDKSLGAVRSVAGGFEVVASTNKVCGGNGPQQ